MIEIKNLYKTFNSQTVLSNINFQIKKGDVISIIGKSGTGKTTLLRCLNFLEKSDKGIIIFDGEEFNLSKITNKQINQLRKKTAFVFQSFNLFFNKTAIQNVMEGLVIARKVKKEKSLEIAKSFLDKVGLRDKYDFYPSQLSGGQQQRVAIARALATKPEIIYFDEPTSALDPELTNEVLEVIKTLANEGLTMIVVTHEMNFAKIVSNKIIFMENGQIIENSNTKDFFNNPKTQRAKEFINQQFI